MKTALNDRIEALPEALHKALEQQAKAKALVAQLQIKIEREEKRIEEQEASAPDNTSNMDDAILALKERTKLEKLALKRLELKARVETEIRSTAKKDGDKLTEATVHAMVSCDPRVVEIEEKYIDAQEVVKIKETEMKYAAMEARITARENALLEVAEPSTLYTRLYDLQDQLVEAEEKMDAATAEVEMQRASLEIYRMLVKLEEVSPMHLSRLGA